MEKVALLTVVQAAKMKGVSISTMYLAVRENRIPSQLILGKIGIQLFDVQNWNPTKYRGRTGLKGKGGRQKGYKMSPETKDLISKQQKQRWAKRKQNL